MRQISYCKGRQLRRHATFTPSKAAGDVWCVQTPSCAACRNMLAKGNPEFCAILVAVNSVLQIVLYAPFALFYLQVSA